MILRFGIATRITASDNPGLTVVPSGAKTQISSGLSFGFSSETRSAKLEFDTSARLKLTGRDTGSRQLASPAFDLAYRQNLSSSVLETEARLREVELSDGSNIQNFDTGTGKRRDAEIRATLNWGQNGPRGLGLTFGAGSQTYSDADPGLRDSTRLQFGINARLDLSAASRIDLGLDLSRFDEVGSAAPRPTVGLTAALTLDQPAGALVLRAGLSDMVEGQRLSLSVGRKLSFPRGTLEAEAGITRSVGGRTYLTGMLDYALTLPRSTVSLKASRRLTTGTDDTERLINTARAQLEHQFTPSVGLALQAGLARSEAPRTGLSVTNASASAILTRTLTPDWTLDLGLQHHSRRDDRIAGRAASNTIFLELRRDLTVRR